MALDTVYREALARCAPEVLVRGHVDASMPRNVVAIGKCAGALVDGVASVLDLEHVFVAMPEGYRLPTTRAEVHVGGHPEMNAASFAAGRALLAFVHEYDDILFLISGGGSACVEVALAPHTEGEIIVANHRLITSNLPIGAINAERRKLSAIKGGKLRARGRAVTLVYSDVATGHPEDVASGPAPPPYTVIADNSTLVRTAAKLLERPVVIEEQIEGDVAEAARFLADRAKRLKPGETLVAGGEPTVTKCGDGRGGRCVELAVRFALEAEGSGRSALFGSSDGVDGNSGSAGVAIRRVPDRLDRHRIAAALGTLRLHVCRYANR
jgi:hydroxypyruvate reductase